MHSPPDGSLPALVLDAVLRQSLVAVRSLGRAGIAVHVAESAAGAPAFASRWCADRIVLPDLVTDPGAYVDRILELCSRLGHPVVIASHDGTIDALRSRRAEVEQVAELALAPEAAMSAAVDKRSTLAVAEQLGLHIPPGVTVSEPTDAAAAVDAIGVPVVIKPAVSWVDGRTAAWRAAPMLARERDQAIGQVSRLTGDGVAALLQRWLPGAREAVSTLYANGSMAAIFAQRAERMSPLLGGTSVLRESIPVPDDIGGMSVRLIRELSLEGYAEVEFRRDADGRPFLMEINPRLSASVEIAVRSGVDFPLLLYRWAASLPLGAPPGYRVGRRMRFLGGDIAWLKEALRDPAHPDAPPPKTAIGTFAAEFARFPGYDFWDARDPAPAAVVASHVARSLPPRIARALRHRLRDADLVGEAT
ncbi:MAG TPA: ATP-grasp domain-containing protein [Solirubrobacteraceae bacterium]